MLPLPCVMMELPIVVEPVNFGILFAVPEPVMVPSAVCAPANRQDAKANRKTRTTCLATICIFPPPKCFVSAQVSSCARLCRLNQASAKYSPAFPYRQHLDDKSSPFKTTVAAPLRSAGDSALLRGCL